MGTEETNTARAKRHFVLNFNKTLFFFYEPVNSDLRLTVLNFLRIYRLNCS